MVNRIGQRKCQLALNRPGRVQLLELGGDSIQNSHFSPSVTEAGSQGRRWL
jgi:hypothetical protein